MRDLRKHETKCLGRFKGSLPIIVLVLEGFMQGDFAHKLLRPEGLKGSEPPSKLELLSMTVLIGIILFNLIEQPIKEPSIRLVPRINPCIGVIPTPCLEDRISLILICMVYTLDKESILLIRSGVT
tara:strand:+ start:338 stop:715 length:378 start_codon:yes stop_codon:yes gene_type:complete